MPPYKEEKCQWEAIWFYYNNAKQNSVVWNRQRKDLPFVFLFSSNTGEAEGKLGR